VKSNLITAELIFGSQNTTLAGNTYCSGKQLRYMFLNIDLLLITQEENYRFI